MHNLLIEELASKVEFAKSKENLREILGDICLLSSNERSNKELMLLLDKAIEKSELLDDEKSLVNLIGYKIPVLYNNRENASEVRKLIARMQLISENNNYSDILAWTYSYIWYIEKFEENKKKSIEALEHSLKLLDGLSNYDEYIYHFIRYSYAVEQWLNNHDIESATILEECLIYFFREGFYRSLAQVFGLLSIIYTRMHESKKALNLSNQILANRFIFDSLPLDVRGIIYYFTGLGHMLNANLAIAESYFNEAYNILKPIYKDSIYYSNFLILHSYLATVKGLQGKTDQVYTLTKEAEILLQTDYIKSNLDENTRKQIVHTLNLVKFYNISCLSCYNYQEHQELINEISKGCKDLYSDFMTFSEFILNSNLDSDKLQRLMTIDNFSINRIKHLIEFMLEKQKLEVKISQEQKALNYISILEKHVTTSKTTFIEHAYRDLLIAQQLFSLKRYAEISPLLKQYESRLKQIEVLEMRIFIEAFIQVGAYKNGDPLGSALQYMAIKKCRLYGFSRLEYTLLNYLQLQQKEITRTI